MTPILFTAGWLIASVLFCLLVGWGFRVGSRLAAEDVAEDAAGDFVSSDPDIEELIDELMDDVAAIRRAAAAAQPAPRIEADALPELTREAFYAMWSGTTHRLLADD